MNMRCTKVVQAGVGVAFGSFVRWTCPVVTARKALLEVGYDQPS